MTNRELQVFPLILVCMVLTPSIARGVVEAEPSATDRSSIYAPAGPEQKRDTDQAIPASPGPHLFIDDELIASSHNLARRVQQPRRDASIPNPIVRGKEDGCYQPYLGVA